MSIVCKNGTVLFEGKFQDVDVFIDNDGTVFIAEDIDLVDEVDEIIDCSGIHIFPGLMDAHTHVREPGFEYKETIKTASEAAAKGGFTTIFSMPNTKPVIDSVDALKDYNRRLKKDAIMKIIPICAITKGQMGQEVVDAKKVKQFTYLFSDDGKGIQNEEMMKEAMKKIKEIDGIILSHCEDERELKSGHCINEGKKSEEYHLVGINNASEYKQVERDIALSRETGCQYHICHISTKESVEALRKAKKEGLRVTGEATAHHILLSEDNITENHGRFKMNPPLRSEEDRKAVLLGIMDGTIDMVASDHAPHSEEEKNTTFDKSSMGVSGIEISFATLYTNLVKTKIISLEKLIQLMSSNVADVFEIDGGYIENYEKANLCFFDLNRQYKVKGKDFVSKGKYTSFEDTYVSGVCCMTIVDGKIVYRKGI